MTFIGTFPFRRNPGFLGREEALGKLFQEPGRSQMDRVQALTGLCGIGKTQVAVEYLMRSKRRYEYIFWFDASSRETLSTQIGRVFLLDETEEEQVFAHLQWWLHENETWLVVLDHLEDLRLMDALIPPQPAGDVLVTTRTLATGYWAKARRLQSLDRDEGALLLLRRARLLGAKGTLAEAPPQMVSLARELAEEVEAVPLVLDQMGAALQTNGGDVAALLTSYRQHPNVWLSKRGKMQDRTHPTSFAETVTQILECLPPECVELLRLFACFAHQRALPDTLSVPTRLPLSPPLRGLVAQVVAYHQAIGEVRCFALLGQELLGRPQYLPVVVKQVVQETLTPPQRQEYRRIGEAMEAEEQKRGMRG